MSTIQDLRAERERYWSQSRVGLFLMCSLKYAFSYIYKLPPEFTPVALPFGSAVHRTLEMLALSRCDGSTLSRDDCCGLFGEIWRRQVEEDENIRYAEGKDANTCLDQGVAVMGTFHDNVDGSEEVLSVSEAMAVPLIDAGGNVMADPLIGEADLVVRDKDGQVVIVDWKTSGQRWPELRNGRKGKADIEVQPTAMLYAYQATHGGDIPVFRYDIVTKAKKPVFQQIETTRKDDDCHRMVETVKAIERAIHAEAFLPQPGFMCAACQYRGACERWHRQRARACVGVAA